jgi:hypothetical protein
MQQIGFKVLNLSTGGIVKHGGADVRVFIDKDGSATIHGWSFPWTSRRKLGYAVERILLASGMQAFSKPYSTNLIYHVKEQPDSDWLERVKPDGTEIHCQLDTTKGSAKMQCHFGWLKIGTRTIRFWTGPAINPESKSLINYLAFDADVSKICSDPILKSLDSALASHRATRLETQRKLDR